jgi:hypothetical protein
VGPNNGSVCANDRVFFKPIDLIQKHVEVCLIPASQVVTQTIKPIHCNESRPIDYSGNSVPHPRNAIRIQPHYGSVRGCFTVLIPVVMQ